MIPDRLKGGYAELADYKATFKAEYIDCPPIVDIRGRVVKFAQVRQNGDKDCEHAIFGLERMKNHDASMWSKVKHRAECLLWIRHALTSTDSSTIHLIVDSPRNCVQEMYLFTAREPTHQRPYEYYAVVTATYKDDPDSLYFVTGYYLLKTEWENKKRTYKKIHPLTESERAKQQTQQNRKGRKEKRKGIQ